jgi:serine O-acetyltransferase
MAALGNVRADLRRHFEGAGRLEDRGPPTVSVQAVAGARKALGALRLVLAQYPLQALLVYRLGRWVRGAPRAPLRWIPALVAGPAYLLLAGFVRLAYDIRIEGAADIGAGFYIGHIGGIRIGRCRIGERCSIHQQVVVEPAEPGGAGPVIGDRVWIGPHAQLRGAIQIGDGATIGGGAEVVKDVPAGALLLGKPSRVVALRYDNAPLL